MQAGPEAPLHVVVPLPHLVVVLEGEVLELGVPEGDTQGTEEDRFSMRGGRKSVSGRVECSVRSIVRMSLVDFRRISHLPPATR